MGSVGGYNVGYDECSRTTEFVNSPGRLDIARVSYTMVTPADNKQKKHTLSTPTSHHQATLSLGRASVGSVGGCGVGYDE